MSLYISALGLNKIDLVSTNLDNFAYSNVINSLVYNYSNLDSEFVGLSNSMSNYETIFNHTLDITNLNNGISNLNIGYSNNSNAISSLILSSSNYETKSNHNSDIFSLNTGISNNTLQINALSVATSNFETILNHNNDISNLNQGYSNNHNDILALSVASSNYLTSTSTNVVSNKTMDFNSNVFLNFPQNGGGSGGSNITSILNISNPWKFKASTNTNQNLTGGVWTTIQTNIEEYDPANSYNPVSYQYTILKSGYYYSDYCIIFLDSSVVNNEIYQARLLVNGVNQTSRTTTTSVKSGNELSLQKANVDYLYIGDTVELQGNSAVNSIVRGYVGTHFNMHLLSITTPIDEGKLYTIVNSSNQITGHVPYWDGYSNQLNINGYNYVGDISNLNSGISNLSIATSNFETIVNHNLDINNLNNGYSNNHNDILGLSVATSNFETIVNHNLDINNLNTGYSNNLGAINALSVATSNFETIVNHNNDINNLNQGYSNNAGAINALSISSSNYITATQNVALTNKTIDYTLNTITNLPSSGGGTTNYNYYDSLELGCILDYAGSNAPTGWLLCYGQAVSRTTYSNLYSIIGTTYGSGDGTTTFNLPDFRGRVSAGLDSNAGVVNTAVSLGTKIGEHLHTLSTSEMPNHTHNLRLIRVAGGGNAALNATRVTTANSYDDYGDLVQSAGSGTPFSNIQPTIVLNKIIKYANNNTTSYYSTSILNVYNPYWGRVFMAQGHSNLVDGVWTDMEINTVAYGNQLGSFNTGTYTYTCPITGVYRFSLGAQFTGGIIGDTVGMRLFKNGISAEMTEERSVIRNGTTVDLGVSDIITLNVGDTIKMQARGIGSSIIDVSGASYVGGGEDITHFSWQLETATNIVGTSNLFTQVNQNTTQTSSNLVMWAGSSNELLTTQLHITNNSNLGIGTANAIYPLDIIDTTAIRLPKGTTAQRPTLSNDGLIRYNTTLSNFEGYSNNVWGVLGGGGSSGGGDAFIQTSTKTTDYTAVKNDEVLVDTNGASSNITISLPASPSAGDQVRIVLITEHATRICLISRNGSSIDGRTTTEGETYYTLWKNGDNITFKYVGGSAGWSGINRNIVNRFAFMAYGSANTNLTFNTFVTCLFDTVIYDYNNSYTTASYKYTIPITGLWCFNAKIMGNGLTDQKRFISEFYKNNTTSVYSKYDTANGTQATNADMTYYVNAVAGDYYVIRVFNDLNPSTGKYVYGGNSSLANWSGYLVSR